MCKNILSRSVSNCYVTQEMHEKAVCYYPGALACVPYQYKIQEMCERAVRKEFRILKYVHDR